MRTLLAFIGGGLAFLAALAIFSRIVTLPNAPTRLRQGGDALTRLFNGSFGY